MKTTSRIFFANDDDETVENFSFRPFSNSKVKKTTMFRLPEAIVENFSFRKGKHGFRKGKHVENFSFSTSKRKMAAPVRNGFRKPIHTFRPMRMNHVENFCNGVANCLVLPPTPHKLRPKAKMWFERLVMVL